jgi:hypothetical protein
MAIVGGHPESGLRVVIERPVEGGPPWRYEGTALTSTLRFDLRATVTAEGEVVVELAGDTSVAPPRDLAMRVRTMIRSAHKHAKDEDPRAAPPRQIHRWRGSSGAF